MPLFGRTKKDTSGLTDKKKHKRYQENLWEAENSPTKQVDFSHCGLKTLSGQAVATIKLNKEALLLHDNLLTSVPASLGSAQSLCVLDLHNNDIKELPAELRRLTKLKVLNLEGNHLKHFPECCLGMVQLETLNLASNKIKELPEDIGQMTRLRTLNLEHNRITQLPVSLHRLRVLQTLGITGNKIQFPEIDAQAATTASVMKALCEHAGVEYAPPSKHLLELLSQEGDGGDATADELMKQHQREQERVERLLKSQDKRHEEQASEQTDYRRREKEEEALRDELLRASHEQKKRLAEDIANRENFHAEKMVQLQDEARKERLATLENLAVEDDELDELARRAVEEWHKKRNDPKLRQAMLDEEDQVNEQFLAVSMAKQASRDAAVAALRESEQKNTEAAKAADMQLEQARTLALDQLRRHQAMLDTAMHGFVQEIEDTRKEHGDTLREEERNKYLLLTGAAAETEARRQARLAEIEDINQRLERLAMHNEDVKHEKQEMRVQELAVQREDLEKRLSLLKQQEAVKEKEQLHTLLELEDHDRRNYRAYWEAKLKYALQHLGSEPVPCDPVVKSLLSSIDLLHLAPKFAESHVDAVVLRVLTDEDLKSMGIEALGDRKKILHAAASLFQQE